MGGWLLFDSITDFLHRNNARCKSPVREPFLEPFNHLFLLVSGSILSDDLFFPSVIRLQYCCLLPGGFLFPLFFSVLFYRTIMGVFLYDLPAGFEKRQRLIPRFLCPLHPVPRISAAQDTMPPLIEQQEHSQGLRVQSDPP